MIGKLQQAGLVEIEKAFEGRQPVTYARLTRAGRDEIAAWGRFQVTLATAAARDNRDADAATATRDSGVHRSTMGLPALMNAHPL